MDVPSSSSSDEMGDYDALKFLPPPRNPELLECRLYVPSIFSLHPRPSGLWDGLNVRLRGIFWFILLLWPQLLLGLVAVFVQCT